VSRLLSGSVGCERCERSRSSTSSCNTVVQRRGVCTRSLVEAAKAHAPRPLAFVASCFNARTTDAVAVVEAFRAKLQPSSIEEVLAELPGHPFDAYAVLAAIQAAGLGRDISVATGERGYQFHRDHR
jgi:hypothetical protein